MVSISEQINDILGNAAFLREATLDTGPKPYVEVMVFNGACLEYGRRISLIRLLLWSRCGLV